MASDQADGSVAAVAEVRAPQVMGVLNVTPDSFSDGGRWADHDAAVAHGLRMAAAGAHLLDVGGESTRPGATRPSSEEELRRVLPVVRDLVAEGLTVSVDTMRAATAEAALGAGATLVNDVSGGRADPRMAGLVAEAGCRFIAMHWRGHSAHMDELANYDDVVEDVVAELTQQVDALLAAGLAPGQLVLDPGFGFSKTAEHNWRLLAHLPRLVALGHPVLVGTSRKRFLAAYDEQGVPDAPADRDLASAVTSVLAADARAWAVRVHDVAATCRALQVWQEVQRAR
ncbi:dihydropteroate synthase [Ornithinicoccus halotolerans]|uniref:dihydropteroate synthase n=1 Tax=Ornithinicoccus halotolerans TaxID=1748220 RepID=UPI001296A352|nr:dihydropteroate synthase [Ornithinicoccus halotolerans]